MMLDYLGEKDDAHLLEKAIWLALRKGPKDRWWGQGGCCGYEGRTGQWL